MADELVQEFSDPEKHMSQAEQVGQSQNSCSSAYANYNFDSRQKSSQEVMVQFKHFNALCSERFRFI